MKKELFFKRKYQSNVIIFLLSVLQETSLATLDIIDLMLSGHTWIVPQARNALDKRSANRQKILTEKFEKFKNKQQIYNLLYSLKKQGFISKQVINRKTRWNITEKGIKDFLSPDIMFLPDPIRFQNKSDKTSMTVIIYDIPNKNNYLRSWLREVLVQLEFKLLQKSVWIGDRQLPEKFIQTLSQLELIPRYVKIFSIAKEGSIYY